MTQSLCRARKGALLLVLCSAGGACAQQAGTLVVTVVAGDAAVNQIRHYVPRPTILEVRNELDQPVGGASVSFAFPTYGPSGTFAGDSRNWMGTTDRQGRIAMARFAPNLLEGSYEITVNASGGSRAGAAVIRETNVRAVTPSASRHMGSATKILLVAGVGAAVAAASLLAIKSGSAAANAPVPSTSISIVSISVGAPH